MSIRILFVLGLLAGLAACTGDGDTEVARATVPADSPDAFLLFPNTQASLGAGEYEVVIGPDSGAAAGTYQLVLTRDDGSTETRNGSWLAGSTATEADIVMTRAGGLKITVTSAVDTHLTLRREGDSHVVATATNIIDLPLSRINSAAYGQAYYDAVDPAAERTTLAAWKAKNGFGAADVHVIFRDAKDLGYGRDMYALRSGSNIAVFVNNYVVALQPGSSSNYGPLNVEAAIAQDARYLQGTNAIEFSLLDDTLPASASNFRITKFFTFDKSGNRITSADLDGRGVKHMPGMCWACHGGQTLPLDTSGKFQAQSLRSAKLNLIDAAQLEYSPQTAYQRPQLETGLRTINQMVHGSFAEMKNRSVADNLGHWSADYAQSLAEGRNGPTISDATNDDFVPAGWRTGPGFPGRPSGTDTLLFKKVIEPHCLGCHSLQGTTAGETAAPVVVAGQPVQLANAINFSSYEKFMSYRSRIVDYVFRRGLMPMSLRNYESFWSNSDNANSAPALLAFFLQDPADPIVPALLDGNGHVTAPGHPVARPGNNRTVKTLPLQLDGNASSFASNWRWTLISQPGSNASLLNATSARPMLVSSGAVANGDYVLELVVSNSKGTSTAVSSTITVDSALLYAPHELTFVQDIVPILNTDLAAGPCINCHSVAGNTGAHPGIPVFWTSDAGTYGRVMERVDLRDPENSKFLTKPTSLNHGGGLRLDRSTVAGQKNYSTIVNWIREGAVCGSSAGGVVCP